MRSTDWIYYCLKCHRTEARTTPAGVKCSACRTGNASEPMSQFYMVPLQYSDDEKGPMRGVEVIEDEGAEYVETNPDNPLWLVWVSEFGIQKHATVVRATSEREAKDNWAYVNDLDVTSHVVAELASIHIGEAEKIIRNWEVL